ncbi:MAG: ribosome-associated ATPase/putative transporter RbbA [Paracoccaceae bacterium]|nr:ribosome-associated ATPase/putative transporter RbbA [Paracoccaceae bacterium]
MTGAPLRVDGVSHQYGRITALRDVSLEIAPASLTGLIGPDGVGKSTLLGLLTGAKQLQSGRIDVFGGDIGRFSHRRRIAHRIAFMPQGLGKNLYPELSVHENLDFFGRLFVHDDAHRDARIRHLLTATGLAPFPNRPAANLSGGMKQKLGLCCALIHDPDLLVLDEPTTGIDPLSRQQFWELIASIRRSRPHITMVVATAQMDEAAHFDSLVAIADGQILCSGTPAQITARTATDSLEDAYRRLQVNSRPAEPLIVPPQDDGEDEEIISAYGLTRKFGDFVAVDDVSFSISRGEIFGFLGSNGCGKSTTMKILTGLLPASAGEAFMLGRPVDAHDLEARRHVGYMSQAFSLYGELSVRQNLNLHARIFEIPPAERRRRVNELIDRFGLTDCAAIRADALPLGLRQRLSLGVAVIHEPSVLILDEPTSGVDPEARDDFWRLLIELSRRDGVTIFLSTHFMAEAERCDRVSLMHDGRVLACDTPARLIAEASADTLEEAFIAKLKEGEPAGTSAPIGMPEASTEQAGHALFSLERLTAFTRRETIEVLRDPVRLAFAVFGPALLMIVFCFGISLDIEDLDFAVFDLSQSPESRAYVSAIEGSRYFNPTAPLTSPEEGRQRLIDGKVSLVVEIPPGFGRKHLTGSPVDVMATVDGAIPFKGETVEGYVAGLHESYLAEQRLERGLDEARPARIETRFRYNQSFESIAAIAPAMPAILLIMLPAILAATSIARERELGSIVNFYVTPTNRVEFLVGKQLPYMAIAFVNFLLMAAMADWAFGVPLKGALTPVIVGAFLFVWASTAFGLVVSTLTSSQVAAVFATALASIIPTIQFSGLLQPVSTLEGGARIIGSLWPASYFLHLNVGAFTKGLGWEGLLPDIAALAVFGPAFTVIAACAMRGQER